MKKIEVGDPVILTDAKGFGKYGFRKGIKGMANALSNAEGIDYLAFMPNFEMKIYWMQQNRFILDEEALKERTPIDMQLDEVVEDEVTTDRS